MGVTSRMLCLRHAHADDCQHLYDWRNHPDVRASAFSTDEITWAQHQNWFEQSLCNPHRILLIGERHGVAVGVLRYDLSVNGNHAEVSIYLSPDYFGKGLGTHLLQQGTLWMQQHFAHVDTLVAEIKLTNTTSQRAFEKAQYKHEATQPDRLIYHKAL